MSNLKKLVTFLLSLLILVGLTVSHTLAATTQVKLLPEVQQVDVGAMTTVTLRVEAVQDLYGYETLITFDPSKLEVIDSDPGKAGVQVGLGTFLNADYVPTNSADNGAGQINVVLSQVAPSTAINGSGALLTISFRGKAVGLSPVSISALILASAGGTEIPADTHNATINVGATAPTATPTNTPTATPTPTGTLAPPTPTPTGTIVAPTATPTATSTPPTGQIIYVVRTGDTLYSIARRFGVTVQAIVAANNISNPHRIYVGQRLVIPAPGTVPTPTHTPTPGGPAPQPFTYVVQWGDTLYSIARRFGTTVDAIAQANNIVNPHRIYVGQRLVIHGQQPTPQPSCTHIVQHGETLTSIARRYGTTVWTLARMNNLPNPNIIYAGQRLHVPC
jgi:LysM repeat protein